MTDAQIKAELKHFEDKIFDMKASEAYEVKEELDAFVEKYKVTAEQMMDFAISGAGELLYMMTC
ncbi:MAG: hypothetical protein Q4A32_03535 [Lachnospiraceae bacterium]|jgi:hypothetical protein|nr:hypothetical protein [Lachnospiraceae bacterium]